MLADGLEQIEKSTLEPSNQVGLLSPPVEDAPALDDDNQGDDGETKAEEDKNRKITRLLEMGDTILDTFNAARVTGLDICGASSNDESSRQFPANHLTHRGTTSGLHRKHLPN